MHWLQQQTTGHEVQVAEPITKTKPEVEQPHRYKVVLINDDFTPMDFVVEVLQYFFHMPREHAIQVMLQVHNSGRAVCGVFTRDIAETKVYQVNDYARQHDNPLLCAMESV